MTFLGLSLLACGCGTSRLDQLLDAAHSSEVEQQRLALRQIADLGAEAAPAVPDLVELSQHPHPDVRRLSGLALGNVAMALTPDEREHQGPDIVAVLTRQLGDDALAVRNTAAFALLDLDPDHPLAQKRLQAAMLQGDGGIVVRLSQTDPPPTWVVPTLVAILKRDSRPGLRRLAAEALGTIQPGNEEVRSALQQALTDSDDRVRSAAQSALDRVTP